MGLTPTSLPTAPPPLSPPAEPRLPKQEAGEQSAAQQALPHQAHGERLRQGAGVTSTSRRGGHPHPPTQRLLCILYLLLKRKNTTKHIHPPPKGSPPHPPLTPPTPSTVNAPTECWGLSRPPLCCYYGSGWGGGSCVRPIPLGRAEVCHSITAPLALWVPEWYPEHTAQGGGGASLGMGGGGSAFGGEGGSGLFGKAFCKAEAV